MDLYLHFLLVNSEFNQGIADDLYKGEESEDNIKYLWEDELKVSANVKNLKIKNNTVYTLSGYKGEKQFSFEITDMTICECIIDDGSKMHFAVSKKLLKKTEKVVIESKNETHLYFYLRDAFPFENPMNGVYILKKDFPKELKNKNPLVKQEDF